MTREPEDTATEIIQNETQKGKEIKKNRLSISCGSAWSNLKIHLLYIREGKKEEMGGKNMWKNLQRLEILYIWWKPKTVTDQDKARNIKKTTGTFLVI